MRSSSVSPYDLQDWAKRAGFELTLSGSIFARKRQIVFATT